MAIKTITIDTVDEFFTKYAKDNWIVDSIKRYAKYIDEIEFSEPNREDSNKIKFKTETSWPQVVMCVAKMKADECWSVTGDKTVTLWWD